MSTTGWGSWHPGLGRVRNVPTIGVAIAIPEPWATQLQDYRTSIGDVTAEKIPTHITLVPPTETDDLPDVEGFLTAVAVDVESFRIHLRGTGTFRPVSPVVFVTVVEGISQCEQLAARVRKGPLASDPEFPYHPHVTIAHHVADDCLDQAFHELAGFDCSFEVTEFHLYLHDDEVGWQPDHSFALRPVPVVT
jgi:2'-5' RNA ligase